MTKKHFILLASALKYSRSQLDEGQLAPKRILDDLVEDVALICKQTNPNFDRSRFLSASNYRGGA